LASSHPRGSVFGTVAIADLVKIKNILSGDWDGHRF
jgi:hypothetical protein